MDFLRQCIKRLPIKRAVIASAAVLALPFVAFTGAANAGTPCYAPWLCLYEHARSEGNQINFYNPGTTCTNLPTPWNDRVSSIHNKTAYPIEFFHHAWCSGISTTVPGNGYIGSYGSLFNDEITSFCRLPC
jgi:hypothetical protein